MSKQMAETARQSRSIQGKRHARRVIFVFFVLCSLVSRALAQTENPDIETSRYTQNAVEPLLVPLSQAVAGHSKAAQLTEKNSVSKSRVSDTENYLEREFSKAVASIGQERKTNDANEFSCTHFLAEFGRFDDLEIYVSFFRRMDVEPNAISLNREHFVYVYLASEFLLSKGFGGFRPDDRLALVFTTGSAASKKVTSFNARLFGKTMP